MTSRTSNSTILNKPATKLLTTWYAEQVEEDKIIACKNVILACERHLNDLKKSELNVLSEDFPWIFNEDIGHRPIKFTEKYCKPSKGNYKQLVMQPWQHFNIGSLFGWVQD